MVLKPRISSYDEIPLMKFQTNKNMEADYVIVGSGPAGCTLARLLSEDGHSVILVEAGLDISKQTAIRGSKYTGVQFGLEQNFYPAYFWQHAALLDGHLVNANPDNSIVVNNNQVEVDLPAAMPSPTGITAEKHGGGSASAMSTQYTTGYGSGGGTSVNGQQWVRGSDGYWKEVQKIGGDLWSPKKVTKRYRSLEKNWVETRLTPDNPTSMNTKFIQAATSLFPEIQKYNDPSTPIGPFTRWQLSQKKDRTRESADIAFLADSNSRKLKVMFKTFALNIVWDRKKTNRAVGVRVLSDANTFVILGKKQVIISAGVYSAELLQRSGVGPGKLLKSLGIPVIVDNSKVGENLQNHTIVPVTFTANPADHGVPDDDPQSLYTGGIFLPPLTEGINKEVRGYQLIGADVGPGLFSILIASLQPQSRGLVRIQSDNPLTISLVDNNYLGNELDIKQYMDVIRQSILKIAAELNKIDPTYTLMTPAQEVIDDDTALTDYIIDNKGYSHHWVGTNAMGSVVDSKLRVIGTKNLSVADVSVLPFSPDGNTQAPAYMIGYTLAQILTGRV